MSQEQRQQAARDEKLVSSADRRSTCNNSGSQSRRPRRPLYEFGLANKKFLVDVEVFIKILDICPRVPNEDFVAPPSEEDLLAFLIELGYKGPLDHLAKMFVDHMHQPWRTLATIINKCLSRKTSNNDRLRQSRVAILWVRYYRKNVDYPELIWEDFAYQIDYRQAKLRRREIMPYPRFTKIIINHFLSLNPSIPKGPSSGMHTIKDDRVTSRLKFVRISEDFQEYGRAIPDTMLTEDIKQTKAYQTFIKYSTGLIPPKKSRDVALELGKSMSLAEADKEEAARRVYATHEQLVMDSYPEPTRRSTRRIPSGITFRDTSSVSKKKSPDQSPKLKGIHTLNAKEQLATDTMQALKAIKNISRIQPHAGGPSEGIGVSPGVPDESTIILTTLREGTGTKPGVPDEVKGSSKAKGDFAIDWGSEEESEYSEEENVDEEIEWLTTDEEEEKKDDDEDDRSIDIEKTDDDEEINDEFVHGDEYVHDDTLKRQVTKGDLEQAGKLPLISSSLSVSSGFGNQFLNLSSDTSLISTTKESADTEINSLLDIQIQHKAPHIQSPSILTVPVLVISEPTVLSPIPEIPTVTPATTLLPPSSVTNLTPILQHQTTPIPTPPITTVAPATTTVPDPLPTIVQRVPAAVDEYLGSSLGDALQKVLQKHTEELIQQSSQKDVFEIIKIKQEQAAKEKMPKFSATPYDQAAEVEFKQNEILFKMMRESKSYEKHQKHKALYDALVLSLIQDEDDLDRVIPDLRKRDREEDEDPSAGSNQWKRKRSSGKDSEPSKHL
ncbi:hypothetical protein Tco_0981627 [Tanacetum coccineum]